MATRKLHHLENKLIHITQLNEYKLLFGNGGIYIQKARDTFFDYMKPKSEVYEVSTE
jgi:hypothetical protein